jgi:hypothetical protein
MAFWIFQALASTRYLGGATTHPKKQWQAEGAFTVASRAPADAPVLAHVPLHVHRAGDLVDGHGDRLLCTDGVVPEHVNETRKHIERDDAVRRDNGDEVAEHSHWGLLRKRAVDVGEQAAEAAFVDDAEEEVPPKPLSGESGLFHHMLTRGVSYLAFDPICVATPHKDLIIPDPSFSVCGEEVTILASASGVGAMGRAFWRTTLGYILCYNTATDTDRLVPVPEEVHQCVRRISHAMAPRRVHVKSINVQGSCACVSRTIYRRELASSLSCVG